MLITEEESQQFSISAIRVRQPIGDFFIASIPHDLLVKIAYFDVRRMLGERDVETYLGIQRPLSRPRVAELGSYVQTVDACFPTAVILAVEERCARFDENTGKLFLKNDLEPGENQHPILFRQIAKVLDGQHRIAGLEQYQGPAFDVNVSIFVDIELEDQAYIFSIVNLEQTKVNRSLAYDLVELAKNRSPQKTSHNIAVALDRHKDSPLHGRVKRLGSATPGRIGQILTQATVVESILPLISSQPNIDRDLLKRGRSLARPTPSELQKFPLRLLFVENRDLEILDILWNYFSAVKSRWPLAWNNTGPGSVLPKTNGFRTLMRVFKPLYKQLGIVVPTVENFARFLQKVELTDDEFNTDTYMPGSSGESALVVKFLEDMQLTHLQKQLSLD